MSQQVKWTWGSLFSGSKEGGGECTHKKIKDKKGKRREDERIKRGAERTHKGSYEILEEGCDSHSTRSLMTPWKGGSDTV